MFEGLLNRLRGGPPKLPVQVNVQIENPTRKRPFYTVKTTGMSDKPMKVPRGMEDLALTEVCLCLPRDWPMSAEWPLRLIQVVALYPHVHRTWVAWGHTLGSLAEPAANDPSGRFVGVLLTAPAHLPAGAEEIARADGRTVRYLAVVPLLEEELRFARERSGEELDEKLTAAGVTELLDPTRKSVV
jgi:Suppressor of fused protein (SUFU)